MKDASNGLRNDGLVGDEDDIPWSTISAATFEELVFALVQAMSPRSAEWRSRPNAINTSDGGRDIEATFDIATPDGDLELQTWWIDCKRRQDTVRPGDVKDVLLNSTVKKHVDVFIIATNSYFSNSTRDWMREFADRFPKPLGKLWDRTHLKKLVLRYPAAAAQALPSLLAPLDRRNLVSSQFFQRGRPLTENELETFWNSTDLPADGAFLVAATYSELLHDGWRERPWAMTLNSAEVAAEALILSLTSLVVSSLRNARLTGDKVTRCIVYLLIGAVRRLPSEDVATILADPFSFLEGWANDDGVNPVREAVVNPVLKLALQELADACSSDCLRISIDPPLTLDPGEHGEHYWKRFVMPSEAESRRSLIITNFKMPCVVGFPVDQERPCPLLVEPSIDREMIETIRSVVEYRVLSPSHQAVANMPADLKADIDRALGSKLWPKSDEKN